MAGDQAQLGGGGWELVEVGDGADKGSEASGRGGQTGGGGEVVLGDEAEGVGGKLREGGIGSFEGGAARAQFTEACLGSGTRNIGWLAVEKEGVAFAGRKRGRA